MRTLSCTLAFSLAASSVASSQVAGRYVFQAPTPDATIPGEIEINGTAPTYGGWIRWITPNASDSAKITQVAAEGPNVTVVADNSAGRYTLRLAFASDTFSGTYEGPQSGTLHGRRLAAVDPVGVYDFVARPAGGGSGGAEGRLVIQGSTGSYTGTLTPDGDSPGTLTSITANGPDFVIVVSGEEVSVTLQVTARADSLVGTYHLSRGEQGQFRAVRVRR